MALNTLKKNIANMENHIDQSAYNQLSNSEKAGYREQPQRLSRRGGKPNWINISGDQEINPDWSTRLVYYPITADNSDQTFTRAQVDAICQELLKRAAGNAYLESSVYGPMINMSGTSSEEDGEVYICDESITSTITELDDIVKEVVK